MGREAAGFGVAQEELERLFQGRYPQPQTTTQES